MQNTLMISRGDYEQIVNLISDYAMDSSSQYTLIHLAFFGHSSLIKSIKLGSAAQEFAVHLVEQCRNYGDIEPGYPALVILLQYLREVVGINNQAIIDKLIIKLRKTNTIEDPPIRIRILMTTANPVQKNTDYPNYDKQTLKAELIAQNHDLRLENQIKTLQLSAIFQETQKHEHSYHVWHHTGLANKDGIYVVKRNDIANLLSYTDLRYITHATVPASIALLHLQSDEVLSAIQTQLQNIGFPLLICCLTNGKAYQQFVSEFYRQLSTGNVNQALHDAMSAFQKANTREAPPIVITM